MKNKNLVIIAVAVVIVAGFLVWYLALREEEAQLPGQAGPTGGQTGAAAPEVKQSLGGQIFEKSSNPLQGKLPSANPVEQANPVEGLYKNPFE